MPAADLQPDPDEWLTVKEIAEELRLTPATIRSWISSGTLKARRAGQRKWLVKRSEIDRTLARYESEDREGTIDTILPPHQSPHWSPEALQYVRRPAWLSYVSRNWKLNVDASRYAPPNEWFVQRLIDIAEWSARKAAALLNLEGEHPGDWWQLQEGLPEGVLSYELSPQANRPGTSAMWAEFDAAVTQLDRAMRAHSVQRERDALARLSLALHDVADQLAERNSYPWPETTFVLRTFNEDPRLGGSEEPPEGVD